jgi:hypothetical protein
MGVTECVYWVTREADRLAEDISAPVSASTAMAIPRIEIAVARLNAPRSA